MAFTHPLFERRPVGIQHMSTEKVSKRDLNGTWTHFSECKIAMDSVLSTPLQIVDMLIGEEGCKKKEAQ